MRSQPTCRKPCDADLNDETVRLLVDLINRVYDDAKSGMWKRPRIRTPIRCGNSSETNA